MRPITSPATCRANPFNVTCPSRDVLDLIGRKWSMLVVCLLRQGAMRPGALRREVEGISQKMLTQTLRELERCGIVKRISYDEIPPRVEYDLTAMGRSLSDIVMQLEDWTVAHFRRIATVQRQFDGESRVAG